MLPLFDAILQLEVSQGQMSSEQNLNVESVKLESQERFPLVVVVVGVGGWSVSALKCECEQTTYYPLHQDNNMP